MLFTGTCWGPLRHRHGNWGSNPIWSQITRQIATGNGIHDAYGKLGRCMRPLGSHTSAGFLSTAEGSHKQPEHLCFLLGNISWHLHFGGAHWLDSHLTPGLELDRARQTETRTAVKEERVKSRPLKHHGRQKGYWKPIFSVPIVAPKDKEPVHRHVGEFDFGKSACWESSSELSPTLHWTLSSESSCHLEGTWRELVISWIEKL